jgi:Na+/melibiose symporter-like transporter
MSDASRSSSGSIRGSWLIVLALLAPAVVLPLCVPLYAREDPTFLGFPFFYWFQFALIVVAVALTISAFTVARRVDRAARVAHGLPPEPDGTGADRKAGDPR